MFPFDSMRNGRGISPAIGVILIIAITVLLAATVAVMSQSVTQAQSSGVSAAVEIEGDGTSDITITILSLANADGIYVVTPNGNIDPWSDMREVGQTELATYVPWIPTGEYKLVAYKGDSPSAAQERAIIETVTLTKD